MPAPISDLDGYVAGAVYDTDFSNPTADAILFDFVNMVYAVDPVTGDDGVQLDDTLYNPGGLGLALSSVATKDSLSAADIYLRYRLVAGNTVAGSSSDGRSSTMTGIKRGTSVWAAGSIYGEGVDTEAIIRGWTVGTLGDHFDDHAPYDQSDKTSIRCTRVQVFQDAMRYKTWLEDDGEPDAWRYLTRVGKDIDFNPTFIAGFWSYVLSATFVSHLTVTALTRTSTDLIHNPTYRLVDSETDSPLWFTPNIPEDSTALCSVVSIPDQNGVTRSVLKVESEPGALLGSALWQQTIYNSAVEGDTFKCPQSPTFTEYVKVIVWSKGVGVDEPPAVNGLCAAYINYFYDVDGVLLSYDTPLDKRYYETLGPRTVAVADGGVGGNGTWDWKRTAYIMEFSSFEEVYSSVVSVGIHDAAASGTLYIGQVSITPFVYTELEGTAGTYGGGMAIGIGIGMPYARIPLIEFTPAYNPADNATLLWLGDAGTLASGSPAGEGDPVSPWVDRVDGVVATNAAQAGRPVLVEVTNNGKTFRALEGDGVSQYLYGSVDLLDVFSVDEGYVAVIIKQGGTDNTAVFDLYATGSVRVSLYARYSNIYFFDFGQETGGRVNTGSIDTGYGEWELVEAYRRPDGTQGIYKNGELLIEGTGKTAVLVDSPGSVNIFSLEAGDGIFNGSMALAYTVRTVPGDITDISNPFRRWVTQTYGIAMVTP